MVGQAATSKGQSDGSHERSPAFYYCQHFIPKASYVLVYISALNYPAFPLTLISFNWTHLLQLKDADSLGNKYLGSDISKYHLSLKGHFRCLDIKKHLSEIYKNDLGFLKTDRSICPADVINVIKDQQKFLHAFPGGK